MRIYLKILANLLLEFLFLGIFFGHLINNSLPSIELAETMKRNSYIKIYDRTNNLIAKHGHLQENIVLVQDLPKHVIHAIIDVEDKKFYKHHGIDFLAILRSFVYNIFYNRIVGGGSTITQQLAKNILQNEEKVSIFDKTLMRKIKEIFLAFKLEKRYTKNEILTLYLNRIYFGCASFGIYSASLTHFNKLPAALNIYEAAALVGLIQAPSKFSGNANSWNNRTKKVLKAMLKNKHISKKEFEDFNKFKLIPRKSLLNYGYYSDWVVSLIPNYLKSRDLIIKTTLDPAIQEKATIAIQKTYNEFGKEWDAEQGAMLILDKNGAVRALVGGIDYATSKFNRAINAQRSVGSFFKYYIYLEALRRGLNPESTIDDQKITLGAWEPSNYLHQSRGKIKIKDAFAQSVNSSAIMILLACGLKNTINLVHKLGITRPIKENPSIALGGFDASLLELTSTIIPILNSGYKTEAYCIEEIRDAHTDEILYKHKIHFEKVLDNRTVWYMWQLMQYVKTGSARSLNTLEKKIVGGKTGTSNNYRDLTFIGATPDYIIGAWFGRDDYQPMKFSPSKHLGVIATRYFLEQMPDTEKDIEIDGNLQFNTLQFEDLLLLE